ncbi:MAG: MBL fold metallo-hydrolase [Rhodospirillales bacterium]|nr:MBL fold metallo-hydrolase [Rhodospirillales bacterium]
MYQPDYAYNEGPEPGTAIEVANSVYWLRMPLPFQLDHINLWLLDDSDEDGDGWTIVDTGIATDETKDAWEKIFTDYVTPTKPVKRVIVTHFHPDHFGLAGWLTERFGVPMWMPSQEWTLGRLLSLDTGSDVLKKAFTEFYHAAGFDADMLKTAEARAGRYAKAVSPVPGAFKRLTEGDVVTIGGRGWRIIVGTGHSPEHACLYCEELDVLISGDQVLPKISPNVSVWPQEPDADPLKDYLESIDKFRGLGPNTLVLPSHNFPFRGLDGRLDDLAGHHVERLEETLAVCAGAPGGATGVDVLRELFKRELDAHQLFFAAGEALAHLHYLVGQGKIRRRMGEDGVYRFF